jgi:hypothetical protein
LQAPEKFTQNGIFGLKIYHLATQLSSTRSKGKISPLGKNIKADLYYLVFIAAKLNRKVNLKLVNPAPPPI